MTDRRIEDQAYRIAVEERIATLWRYRAWWRRHRWAEWPLRRQETDIELRALVRLARMARKAARPIEESADPVTLAKAEDGYHAHGYHEWQAMDDEPNVEGMPAFNGAFR